MKEIHLHEYKTGRVRRYGYYEDFRAASCAHALLLKYGWLAKPIKKLRMVERFYVFSEKVPARR